MLGISQVLVVDNNYIAFDLFAADAPTGVRTAEVPVEFALIGTLIGICILIPGLIVWYYFRTAYSYLGLRRFLLKLPKIIEFPTSKINIL